MAADDVTARRCGLPALAGALRALAIVSGPAGALAAAGPGQSTLTRRPARLESPAARTRRGARALAWTFFGSAVGAPLAAFTMAIMHLQLPC